MLIPSSHVTDFQTLNPVLQTCLILFSVFHSFPLINYCGDFTILKIKIIFLFAVPVVTPVATVNKQLQMLNTIFQCITTRNIYDTSLNIHHLFPNLYNFINNLLQHFYMWNRYQRSRALEKIVIIAFISKILIGDQNLVEDIHS